jgi:hypothetical protein
MPFTRTRKMNKRFSYYKFAIAVITLTALSAFCFTGCMSPDEGVALGTKYNTGNIIISGKFAVTPAPAASPSLDAPVPASRSAFENAAPSYALIGQTVEIILKDLNSGSVLASAITDPAGRFQFIGPLRNVTLAIGLKGGTAEIILGRISSDLPDNSVVSISRTNNDIDEYYAIASNITKNIGTADKFTISRTGPETLFYMVDKLKAAGAEYMYQNPAVDLKTILNESSNPQSAVTKGVIQKVPVGAFIGFRVTALTPQKVGNAIKISVTAIDLFGNAITNYSGPGTLAITGAAGTAVWFGTGVASTANGAASFGAGAFASGAADFYLTNTAGDADKTVTVTDSATGRTGSVKVSWVNNIIDHFEITGLQASQTAGVPFKVTIYARDKSNSTVTDFTSEVSLSNAAQRIFPPVTGNFTAGVWQGNVTVYKSAAADFISAFYQGAAGRSSNFDVLPAEPSRLALISPPAAAQIAGEVFGQIQIGVYDTFENLVQNDSATKVVAERGSYGGYTLKGTLVRTAAKGIVTFNDLKYEKAENISVKFSFAANSSIKTETEQLTVTPAAAAKLVVNRAPSASVTSGAIFETQPVINICDPYSNIVTEGSLSVKAQTGSIGTSTLSGNTIIAAVKGVAEFTNLSYGKAENFTIKFTVGDSISVETSSIKLLAAAFDNFEIIPSNASASASSEIILEVKARDANNNYISDYSKPGSLNIVGAAGAVTWSGTGVTNSGNGRGAYAAASFSNGTAFIRVFNATADANKTVTITDTETGRGGTAQVSWTAGRVDHFEVAALPNQIAGRDFAVTITAKDISNNTVTDFSSALTLNDDTGTITPKTLSQFTGGVCSADVKITKASAVTIVQATSGLITGKSRALVISPDAAVKINIVKQPLTGQAGAPLTPPLQVMIYDVYNNQVTNDNTTQINVEAGQSPAALKGSTSKTAVNGNALFDDLSYQKAENITLSVSASGLTPVTSAVISITPGAPAKLAIIQQPDNPLKAGTAFPKNFKIAVCDICSNVITGDNTTKITMGLGSYGTSEIEGITSRTVNNGIAEFSSIIYKKAENVSFMFKIASATVSVESDPYVVLPGPANYIKILTQPSAVATAGNTFQTQPQAAVCDVYGNNVTESMSITAEAVTPEGSATGKPLGGAVTKALVNGVAAFTDLYYTTAGQIKIKFTANGGSSALPAIISSYVTISSGSAAKLSWVNNEKPVSPQRKNLPFSPDIRVAVCDTFGNIIVDDVATKIKAAKLSGGGTLTGEVEVSVKNGISLFSNLKYDTAEEMKLQFTSGSFPALASDKIVVNP